MRCGTAIMQFQDISNLITNFNRNHPRRASARGYTLYNRVNGRPEYYNVICSAVPTGLLTARAPFVEKRRPTY